MQRYLNLKPAYNILNITLSSLILTFEKKNLFCLRYYLSS